MNKKINNKTLFFVLVGLVAIFLITNYLKKNNRSTAIDTELINVDSSAVSHIMIQPTSGNKQEINFAKSSGGVWSVQSGEITTEVKEESLFSALSELAKMKIKRMVAKTEDKWEKYQVGEETATRLTVKEDGGEKTLDIYLGKIKYQQPSGGFNQYGGRNQFTGSTYIRLSSGPEIYEVDGFLPMTFNQDFSAWRKNDFIATNRENITRLSFNHSLYGDFSVTKQDSSWNIDGDPVDSVKIESYLNLLSSQPITQFEDNYTPQGGPDCRLTISGNNMDNIVVECFKDNSSSSFFMKSSLNPNVFAKVDSTGLYRQLFIGQEEFLVVEGI